MCIRTSVFDTCVGSPYFTRHMYVIRCRRWRSDAHRRFLDVFWLCSCRENMVVKYSWYFENRRINVIMLKWTLECMLWAGFILPRVKTRVTGCCGYRYEPPRCIKDGYFLDHTKGLSFAVCRIVSYEQPLFLGRLFVVQSSLCRRGELEISHVDEFVARLWRQISSVPATYDIPTHTRTAAHSR